MRRASMIISIFLLSVLSACMTVTRGTTEVIHIVSKPVGAEVRAQLLHKSGAKDQTNNTNGTVLSCSPTPCDIVLPRASYARVSVQKDGYEPIKFLVLSKGSTPTSTIKPGMIVAGTLDGSHVIAGTPSSQSFLSGNTMSSAQILTFYGTPGAFIDMATGANRVFSPNPVTVILNKNGGQEQ